MHFSPVFANVGRGSDTFERVVSGEVWLLLGYLTKIQHWHFFPSLTKKIRLVEKIQNN